MLFHFWNIKMMEMALQLEKFQPGLFRQGHQYRYFLPNHINDQWSWESPLINQLLETAAIRLGELNSYAHLIPDIDLFIQLHVTKEALVSSRIEGTKTNINEMWLREEQITPERRDDWREVKNYVNAMNESLQKLQTLPISSRLLRNAHGVLMEGVRGQHRNPGEFRTSQNWIGGNSLADAVFIPPSQEHVPELMSDLEKFLNNPDLQIPTLVRIAIANYQFETIHPFLDGNGRIGRLLIPLYLVSRSLLDQPLLYFSTYFENDRGLYYDNLTRVRTHGDMLQWLKYFLVGIEKIATEAAATLSKIMELRQKVEGHIYRTYDRRAFRAIDLLQALFKQPIIDVKQAAEICQTNYRPANELVELMCVSNVLREITGQSRNRLFAFSSYLELFEDRSESG